MTSTANVRSELRLLEDVHRAFQAERQNRFSGQLDLLVPGERRSGSTRASARKSANRRPFASAGQAADNRSKSRAPADESGTSFALALFSAFNRACGHRVCAPLSVHAIQAKLQTGSSFETSQWFRVNDRALRARPSRHHSDSVHRDIICHRSAKLVPRLADLRSQLLIEANP
jgi:hypothetical protein